MAVVCVDQSSSKLAPVVTAGRPAVDVEPLVGAVLDELLNSALLAATSASIANWMAAKQDFSVRSSLACYLPPVPTVFPQAALELCLAPDTFHMSTALREYYDRLGFLRALTTNSEGSGVHGKGSFDVPTLIAAWQDLAAAARDALAEVIAHADADTARRSDERYRKVTELLSAVAAGQHPCVDASGLVTVPFWAERRSVRRTRVSLQAYLVVADGIQRVSVVDAGERSLGIVGLSGGVAGAKVQLLVKPGRSIAGKVIWSEGDRAGIALEEPLPPDSSLLTMLH